MNNTQIQKDTLLSKIDAQLNEEKILKGLSSVQLSRIQILESIVDEAKTTNRVHEIANLFKDNLEENPTSLTSRYILGYFQLEESQIPEILQALVQEFTDIAKWTIVEHLADLLLKHDENNKIALCAKIDGTEQLKGKKKAQPYVEKLAKLDRKNPHILRKYAMFIMPDDLPTALTYLKQAGESYARMRDYKNLQEVWQLLVKNDHEDIGFFERIERLVSSQGDKLWIAANVSLLVDPFQQQKNWDRVIQLLKKVIGYEPTSTRYRNELIKAYKNKYSEHSLLDDFLKMSGLTDTRKNIEPSIAHFEHNIILDKGHYVYHKKRGVGKILEMDSAEINVEFAEGIHQKMSIQMAITSLQPLHSDHIWIQLQENPDKIKEMFENDVIAFFKILLSSFDNKLSVSRIKKEILTNEFIPAKEWTKWWSKIRNKLKKHAEFGFNPYKKDELIIREISMSFAEELTLKFQVETDWYKKMSLALETLKDNYLEDAGVVCIEYYKEQERNKSAIKKLYSFLFLESMEFYTKEKIPNRFLQESYIVDLLNSISIDQIALFSSKIYPLELKRLFVDKIIEIRKDDYTQILTECLYETPIKIHRYIIQELMQRKHDDKLQEFFDELCIKYRNYPENFLWFARFIITDQWDYSWIKHSKKEIFLLCFRLLKVLEHIEMKGTRLKNQALEIIFGTTHLTVEEMNKKTELIAFIKEGNFGLLRRVYSLFRDVHFVPLAYKENLLAIIKREHIDFILEEIDTTRKKENWKDFYLNPSDEHLVVSAQSLDEYTKHLDHLINVDMSENSKDIGEAQEKGDLRENAEYKAALEKQAQLQAEISKLSEELKRATIIEKRYIDITKVSVGTHVVLKTEKNETKEYIILGPWDADSSKNIISYGSPLARALFSKKKGDKFSLIGIEEKVTIQDISIAKKITD